MAEAARLEPYGVSGREPKIRKVLAAVVAVAEEPGPKAASWSEIKRGTMPSLVRE